MPAKLISQLPKMHQQTVLCAVAIGQSSKDLVAQVIVGRYGPSPKKTTRFAQFLFISHKVKFETRCALGVLSDSSCVEAHTNIFLTVRPSPFIRRPNKTLPSFQGQQLTAHTNLLLCSLIPNPALNVVQFISMGVDMSARRIKQAFNVPTILDLFFDHRFNLFNHVTSFNSPTYLCLNIPSSSQHRNYPGLDQLFPIHSPFDLTCTPNTATQTHLIFVNPWFLVALRVQESKEFIHTMKPGIPKNCLTLQSLYTSLSNYCTYSDEASMAPQRLEGDASRAAAIGSNHNKAAGDRGPNAVMPRGPCTT
ncbi:hypothetical protein C8F04DRAFT_1193196 [Mycena alexandri]|uniref:Uncharacterized protein n=1 Tax=Mycena alexandri TaxID=1745969 RepID=A0AAD6S9F9_9AGAR|nr:hypothetical protein C8F04DRAFT_1193196 [Mycena alexandri]